MSEQKNKVESIKSKMIKQLESLKGKGVTDLRIFQIAKILDVSHTDIMGILKSMNFPFSSHMAPIDFETLDLIIGQLKNPLDNNHLKNLNEKLFEMIKTIEEKERRKKEDEELKKMNKGVRKSNYGLAYSESLNEYMPYNEIKQDHIEIDGEWFHEDQIGHDR